jgi:hypothetical protein
MMSVRDKPGNESWALPDHGDEQFARAQVPYPELVLPSSEGKAIEWQTDPINLAA